jgi:hypothetical protein
MRNNFDDLPDIPEEALDDLLRSAVWPESDPASVTRLQQQLKQSFLPPRRKHSTRWAILIASLAVGLLISATIWAYQFCTRKNIADFDDTLPKPASRETPHQEKEIASNLPDRQAQNDAVADDSPSPIAQEPLSRDPTPYEALIFEAAFAKRKAALKAQREQSLAQKAKSEEKPKPFDRAAGVRDALPLTDSNTLARWIGKEENPDLQEEMFAALLARGDGRSIELYLDFVAQRDFVERALAALYRVKNPPVDVLFDFLRGVHASRRLAAALVLGRIDGPETSRKLFQMVCSNVGRQEAMVALLASSGNDASFYVNLAKKDLSLAGIVSSAQYKYRTLSITQ